MYACMYILLHIHQVMKERAECQRVEDEKKRHQMEVHSSPLVPLLQSLQHFHSLPALDSRIRGIYEFLDSDLSGSLSKVCGRDHTCIPQTRTRMLSNNQIR